MTMVKGDPESCLRRPWKPESGGSTLKDSSVLFQLAITFAFRFHLAEVGLVQFSSRFVCLLVTFQDNDVEFDSVEQTVAPSLGTIESKILKYTCILYI